MRRRALVALAALATLALSACSSPGEDGTNDWSVPELGPARVDVDTPELRRAKKALGVAPCRPGRGAPVDGGLPAVELACFGGGRDVDLSTLRGPLVVNVWAQTCGPCRREMPLLQSFHEQYGDRVGVLGIDFLDVQPELAMELVEKTGVTYPLLADPDGQLQDAPPIYRIKALPYLALVDDRGRLAHQEFTVLKSEAQLVGLVREHLGVSL